MCKRKIGRTTGQIKLVYDTQWEEGFPLDRLMEELGLEMQTFATSAGLLLMKSLIKAEEEHLAGEAGNRKTEINRWSKERGSVVVGGQRQAITKQRLRSRSGEEVALKSYTKFHNDDERTRAIYQRMLAGVSCRNYRKTLEKMAKMAGVSKSVVSRKIVESTEADMKAFCERDLSGLDICVILIDGMPLDHQMTIAVVGVETTGKKHVLGFREGSTENAEVCKSLFEDLVSRGLKMDREILFIIDGSKALRKAVDDFYGNNAVVQRCQFHKSENLRKHLTEQYQAEYERKLNTIYGMNNYDDAHRALKALIGDVERLSISAARSLEEGFEETLTVHRLGIPGVLRESFSTTNIIESTFSVAENVMRNVKRWRNPMQRLRWSSTAFLFTENQYRRVRGYKSMPVLLAALENEVRKQKGERIAQVA